MLSRGCEKQQAPTTCNTISYPLYSHLDALHLANHKRIHTFFLSSNITWLRNVSRELCLWILYTLNLRVLFSYCFDLLCLFVVIWRTARHDGGMYVPHVCTSCCIATALQHQPCASNWELLQEIGVALPWYVVIVVVVDPMQALPSIRSVLLTFSAGVHKKKPSLVSANVDCNLIRQDKQTFGIVSTYFISAYCLDSSTLSHSHHLEYRYDVIYV